MLRTHRCLIGLVFYKSDGVDQPIRPFPLPTSGERRGEILIGRRGDAPRHRQSRGRNVDAKKTSRDCRQPLRRLQKDRSTASVLALKCRLGFRCDLAFLYMRFCLSVRPSVCLPATHYLNGPLQSHLMPSIRPCFCLFLVRFLHGRKCSKYNLKKN